jgi:protein phosphatase 1L
MENQEAVSLIRKVKDPETAAKKLTEAALTRKSKDDISCIVVRLK